MRYCEFRHVHRELSPSVVCIFCIVLSICASACVLLNLTFQAACYQKIAGYHSRNPSIPGPVKNQRAHPTEAKNEILKMYNSHMVGEEGNESVDEYAALHTLYTTLKPTAEAAQSSATGNSPDVEPVPSRTKWKRRWGPRLAHVILEPEAVGSDFMRIIHYLMDRNDRQMMEQRVSPWVQICDVLKDKSITFEKPANGADLEVQINLETDADEKEVEQLTGT